MRRTLRCTRLLSDLPWPSHRRPTVSSLPALALSLLPQRAWNSENIKLRNYQEDCIQAILTHMNEGGRRMAISLATGGGKTIIFTELISRLTHPVRPKAEKTLILVHRRELVQQAAKQCEKQYPGKVIDIEMASSHARKEADIIVASVQSIINRLEKYDAELYKLVLIDECHHAVSPSYLKVLRHFQAIEVNDKTPVVVGVSATVSRFDGLSLGKVLDRLVFHMDSATMIENEWLSPPRFTTVSSSVDLTSVGDSATGDFDIRGLGRAVNTDVANHVIVKTWMDRAPNRKSTLVFCVDLAHVRSVMDKFRAHGIDAREVTSRSPTQIRRECLDEFKAGKFPVMVNCGVFTEGTDIPNIDCVILARPTRSKNLITQMIGRGLRKSKDTGKIDCHVIDMVANLSRGIVTTPTLFGLDPDMVVNEMTPDQMRAAAAKEAEARRKAGEEEEKRLRYEQLHAEDELRRKEEARLEEEIQKMKEEKRRAAQEKVMRVAEEARIKAEQEALERKQAEIEMEEAKREGKKLAEAAERQIAKEEGHLRAIAAERLKQDALARISPAPPIKLEYTDYEDIWDLLSDSRSNNLIYKMSRLAWVAIHPSKYILSCGRNGYIKAEMDCDGWYNVEEFRSLPPEVGRAKWAKPKLVMSGVEQLDAAIRGADTYVLSTYPRILIERSSSWRKLPASDQQLEFLKKFRHRGDKDWEDMRKSQALTKGMVGDIITRVKHGTVRHFDEKMKEEKRKEKEKAKESKRRLREEVKLQPSTSCASSSDAAFEYL
ncbi:unnamed protein product [Tuber aestivum]|uniref:P-loop containing nucleoside triphosphate hydrolase protein n=1 Tax=Tuber aestivum TaxID=59557 RepID=A0A292PKT3_9PEZI|nr:unnamed protein product [Tuber aestivum]